MPIMLVFALLAFVLIITNICIAAIGLLLGTILLTRKNSRLLALLVLFTLPSGSISAIVGAYLVGRYLININGSLLLWGPLIGYFTGATAGIILGCLLTGITWMLMVLIRHREPVAL